MGKTDISPPISERTWIAVSGLLSNPGTVRIRERVTHRLFFSRILKTGIQYLPVDSIQMSLQLYFASQPHNSCNPLVKEEKRACLYSVRPSESVIPMQAKIHVLWTSSPQQFLRIILKDNKVTSFRFIVIKLTVTGHLAKSSRLWKR